MSKGQKFAKSGGNTISDNHIVRYTYIIVAATKLFTKPYTDRRKKVATDRTWDKYGKFFAGADKDRAKILTALEGTYTADKLTNVPSIIERTYAANQVEEMVRE